MEFIINNKIYNVKTDKNGYAFVSLDLKPNSYIISATYHNFTVFNKVIVKSIPIKKIIVKRLSIKKFTIKKCKIIIFKVKLVNSQGKSLKGKKITFKFKGKKYKIKTKKNGIATLKIKKKLKVGKYSIVASYGKFKVKQKFSIKSK